MNKPTEQDLLLERLQALRIDSHTRHNVGLMRPHLRENIDGLIEDFYDHFLSMPSAQPYFNAPYVGKLKLRQRAHWLDMFECRFDASYLSNAVRIGQAHFDNKVPLRLYLAGQSHFYCSMIEVAARRFGASRELPVMLASLARVLSLDVDLATSAYTRALWIGERQRQKSEVWV